MSYDPYPLKVLFSAELEDLHYGNAPYDPETQEWLVRRAANVIREEMDGGKGFVVHCMGGIGRTGTIIGCVLKNPGFSADEVINYLDRTTGQGVSEDGRKRNGRRKWCANTDTF